MIIDGTEIGHDQPTWICAEIGINANGSVDIAKKLIGVAVIAGCNAVKFQKRTIDVVYTKEELERPRESPFGKTNGDLKRGLEFNETEYGLIDMYCKEKGITWFASPWDVESVKFLEGFDVPVYKVASPCITDDDLIDAIREKMKPVIVSTGMSNQDQVSFVYERFPNIVLLATTSTYPCKLEELNLNKIKTLKSKYGCPVGYSNHFPGLWMSLCAVALGACVLEVHITLDRSMVGSDQSSSIEPAGLIKLVQEIRDFEKAKGDGKIGLIESEKPIMEKLRRF